MVAQEKTSPEEGKLMCCMEIWRREEGEMTTNMTLTVERDDG